MVFIKRSIAKLEYTGEEKPEWLKTAETAEDKEVEADTADSEEDEDKE